MPRHGAVAAVRAGGARVLVQQQPQPGVPRGEEAAVTAEAPRGRASCFGALRSPCGCGPSATEAADQEEEEEDEEVDQYGAWECGGGELIDVDYRAEEFINMFYEQLRAQSFHPPTVLQCRSP